MDRREQRAEHTDVSRKNVHRQNLPDPFPERCFCKFLPLGALSRCLGLSNDFDLKLPAGLLQVDWFVLVL